MKRIISLVVAVLLTLCSCSRAEERMKIKSADSLEFANSERSFPDCRDRYFSVIASVKAKVDILEREHNEAVKRKNKTDFFLENDYILAPFEPFLLQSFKITDGFGAETFELEDGGADGTYDSDGGTFFVLRLVSEERTKEYKAEYSPDDDAFRYVFSIDDTGGLRVEEFLEFSKADDGAYVVQSNSARCRAEFDAEGNIVSFVCGELKTGEFSLDESVYPVPGPSVDKYWATSRGKMNFSNIRSFENGVLTHEDYVSGSWKSVKIKQSDYESAFYM